MGYEAKQALPQISPCNESLPQCGLQHLVIPLEGGALHHSVCGSRTGKCVMYERLPVLRTGIGAQPVQTTVSAQTSNTLCTMTLCTMTYHMVVQLPRIGATCIAKLGVQSQHMGNRDRTLTTLFIKLSSATFRAAIGKPHLQCHSSTGEDRQLLTHTHVPTHNIRLAVVHHTRNTIRVTHAIRMSGSHAMFWVL